MTIDETFETLKRLFNPAGAVDLDETFQWEITGTQAGKWALRIANQTCQLIKGGVEQPDLNMSMSDEVWLGIASGKLDPVNAFTTGKIKMSGDTRLAMRLQQLFPVKGRFFDE
jgi:putative sterol carrier protein